MYDLENMKKYFKDNCINQKLLELYKQKWKYIEEIKSKDKDGDIVFQLACIPANYYKCNYKVLIVGQETYKWHNRKSSAEDSMLYTLEKEYMKKTSSAFALFAYNFVSKINNFNSKCYKKSYFAWSNLRKFCYKIDNTKKKKPSSKLPAEIENIIDKNFYILEDEIKIINPDIVLFLTGPIYDEYLKKHLENIKFENVDNYKKKEFAKVIHSSLPEKSFRIYHPVYLQRIKRKKEYLNKLVELCQIN